MTNFESSAAAKKRSLSTLSLTAAPAGAATAASRTQGRRRDMSAPRGGGLLCWIPEWPPVATRGRYDTLSGNSPTGAHQEHDTDGRQGPRGDRRAGVRGRVHPDFPGPPERRDVRRL